jgi:hypothetical protein
MDQALVTLLLGLLNNSGVWNLINKTRAEGRPITEAEINDLFNQDDEAREQLQQAIDRARAEQVSKPA